MLNLKSKSDLQRLVEDQIQESLTLEYKASAALSKDSKPRSELYKDVSALANSAGGQIVYGIEEKDQKPVRVDDGNTAVTREWIEQVIDSNIQPRIVGLVIDPIQLDRGLGYVLTVPQATSRAPHQAPDKKYYKRQNFSSVPMEDYEIRDVIRRASTPDLMIEFYFDKMQKFHQLQYTPTETDHLPAGMTPLITNRSNEPALYAVVTISVDARLTIQTSNYERLGPSNIHGTPQNVFRLRFNPNQSMPIFKEQPTLLPALGITVPDKIILHLESYSIGYEIRAPGCFAEQQGILFVENGGTNLRVRP